MKKIIATLVLLSGLAFGQTAVLMPLPRFFASSSTGQPLAGGRVYTYAAGTTNPQATFTSSTGGTTNSDPVILDAGGGANIWLQTGVAYKICVQNAQGVQQYCADNVTGLATQLASSFAASTTVPFSSTPTFTALAQNQLFKMTLTGNVTASSMPMTGVAPPAVVTFEITQDGTGSHTFAFPPNVIGAIPIFATANSVSMQAFTWDGTNAISLGPEQIINGGTAGLNVPTLSPGVNDQRIASTAFVQAAITGGIVSGAIGACSTCGTVNANSTAVQMIDVVGTGAAGAINHANSTVHLHAAGTINSVLNSSTAMNVGACFKVSSTVTAGGFATIPATIPAPISWTDDLYCTVAATGSSGNLSCSGSMGYTNNAGTVTTIVAVPAAITGNVDLTGAVGIGPCVSFPVAGSASNSASAAQANAEQTE